MDSSFNESEPSRLVPVSPIQQSIYRSRGRGVRGARGIRGNSGVL